MALNSGALNSFAINDAAEFVSTTGGGLVVTIEQEVHALSVAGVNVSFDQIVGFKHTAGVNVSIAQAVLLRKTGGGVVVTLEQAVKSLGSKVIDLEQSVVTLADPLSFHDRNGYEPIIYINRKKIPLDQLHGRITCTYTENDAPQLKFTIIPDTGAQDIRRYRGNTVVFKIREGSVVRQIFSGKVNIPDVQIIDQKITFNCSLDIEQNVENLLSRSELDKIGLYNNSVFAKPETKLQELRDRLSTIPSVLNFRKSGVPAVDPIATGTQKASLNDADVYRTRTEFDYRMGSGQRYINKVNLKIDYTYQRLHHHELGFRAGVQHTSVCELLEGGYDILMRALVSTAVAGSAWPLKGNISYDPIYAPGWYQCASPGTGAGPLAWSTTSCTKSATPAKPSTSPIAGIVSDDRVTKNGDRQKTATLKACTNSAGLMCLGASWTSTTRFSQNVRSEYTITIQAPQSISDNGVKERDLSYSLSSSFESSSWEDYQSFSSKIPPGTSVAGTQGNNYWINADTNKALFDSSVNIMLNKAKSDILKSHREDRVLIKRSLWSDIDMSHTIKINTTKLNTKGRVYTFTHNINIGTGEAYTTVELSLSQSTGSASNSVLAIPDLLTNTPVYPSTTINLGNGHYGEDPTQPGAELWTGHIANKYILYPFWQKTAYSVSFVVNVPPISNALRSQSTLTSTPSYNVSIPNDTLSITFDE